MIAWHVESWLFLWQCCFQRQCSISKGECAAFGATLRCRLFFLELRKTTNIYFVSAESASSFAKTMHIRFSCLRKGLIKHSPEVSQAMQFWKGSFSHWDFFSALPSRLNRDLIETTRCFGILMNVQVILFLWIILHPLVHAASLQLPLINIIFSTLLSLFSGAFQISSKLCYTWCASALEVICTAILCLQFLFCHCFLDSSGLKST